MKNQLILKTNNMAFNKYKISFFFRSRKIRENEIENPEYLRMCKALSLGIAYAANCGGVASLTGTNPNVIMKGVADKYGKIDC